MASFGTRNANAAACDDREASHHPKQSQSQPQSRKHRASPSSRKSRPLQQGLGQGPMHADAGPPTGHPTFRASLAPVSSHPVTTTKSTTRPPRLSRNFKDAPLNVLSDSDTNIQSTSQSHPPPSPQQQQQQQQHQFRNAPVSFASNFPQSFERWETLSSHWEGLTNYWLHRLETNSDSLQHDPLSKQMARQITDLSATGANLFHALVELQRLRASSERKYQRWYNDAKTTAEKAVREKRECDLEIAREKARCTNLIAAANQAANRAIHQARDERVRTEQKVLRELQISRNEARRAWEELGRREQDERQSVAQLRAGKAAVIRNIEVVPVQSATATAMPPSNANAQMEHDSPVYANVYDLHGQGSLGLTDPFSEYPAREGGEHHPDLNRPESMPYPPRDDELSTSSEFEGHDLDDPSMEEEDDGDDGASGSVPHRYVSRTDSEDSEDYGTQIEPQQGINAAFNGPLPVTQAPLTTSSIPPPHPPPPPLTESPPIPLPMPIPMSMPMPMQMPIPMPMPAPMNRPSPTVTIPMPYLPQIHGSSRHPYPQPEAQPNVAEEEQGMLSDAQDSPYTHDAEYSGASWGSPTSEYEYGDRTNIRASDDDRDGDKRDGTGHDDFVDSSYDLHRVPAAQAAPTSSVSSAPPAPPSVPLPPLPSSSSPSNNSDIKTNSKPVSPSPSSPSPSSPPTQSSPTQDDSDTADDSPVHPHGHPTRLSDVIEEDDERSQRSQRSQGGASGRTTASDRGGNGPRRR